MTTDNKRKMRDEWRALNLQINQLVKSTEQNKKAGYQPSEEFTAWLNALINRRNELTELI